MNYIVCKAYATWVSSEHGLPNLPFLSGRRLPFPSSLPRRPALQPASMVHGSTQTVRRR